MNTDRLTALRQELTRQGLDGFVVPRADEHLGEYVPASAERLSWLTGFTGSAGLAIVLTDKAAVFTDGRYVLQLAAQTDAALWEQLHVTEQPPSASIGASVAASRPHRIATKGSSRATSARIAHSVTASQPLPRCEAGVPACTVSTRLSSMTPRCAHGIRSPVAGAG